MSAPMMAVYIETILGPPLGAGVGWLLGQPRLRVIGWVIEAAATLAVNIWQGISTHDFVPALVSAGMLVAGLLWHWWRKRRDRVKAALGAKSKALRDALVRRARESARPSPVLRPSLGGAR